MTEKAKAKPPKTKEDRQRGAIHSRAKQAGMDDDTYRKMLVEVGGVKPKDGKPASSKDLDAVGIGRVLDHLAKLTGTDPLRPPAADIAADPQLQKIDALLLDAKRNWGYLLSKGEKGGKNMMQRLTGKDRLRFCTAADLGKVISALEIDKARRAAKA